MPRLSLGLGVQSVRKVKAGAPAAPLVVATTNAVNISGNNVVVPDGTYTKVTTTLTRVAGSLVSDKLLLASGLVYLKEAGYGDATYPTSPYGYILIPPNTTFTATGFNPLTSETFWRAGKVYGLDVGDENYDFISLGIDNPSTDATIIPTSDWGYGITITAA
jgi:hypothetical protein